jgi:crotonobetainyl-CoA:carnitine CoA-transferase CaiB-like acyl-CoA transferase
MGTDTPTRPLDGVRIAAFTQFLMGPAGVQYLSDLGADVIKVENPSRGAWERSWAGGDTFLNGVSAFFLLSHRNVRSVALDLKRPAGRDAALRLFESADVVVENFRPGVMEGLGLGYEAARERRPDVIYASATGYGSSSPYRSLPGQDLLIQALTGLSAATGCAGQSPVPAGAPVVDQHGAALLALGILAALLHRARTGEGQHIEVNMIQAALDLQQEPVVYHLNGTRIKATEERLGSAFHAAPYGLYPTRDGYIAISMSSVASVRAALGGVDALAPYEDPAIALAQRDEVYRAVAGVTCGWAREELLDALRAGGVWCSPVNDYDDVFADDRVRCVNPVIEVEHPEAGTVKLLPHPVGYSRVDTSVRSAPPAIGEHTAGVLAELGYSDAELEGLINDGVAR